MLADSALGGRGDKLEKLCTSFALAEEGHGDSRVAGVMSIVVMSIFVNRGRISLLSLAEAGCTVRC